ncbi:unnamed protein product [Anisakis simplex]|uniref:PH_14 domain-containing protein n=1 Tax=Anisakis simplex TaxID=6269 RepID=A0A0M3J2S7_ANISI|nr:unnamed protein product [Anisakis simplex]
MKPESKFCTGQRFLKWKGKNADPNSYPGPGHSCVLRVDPGGHIFYWTREHNWSKTKRIAHESYAVICSIFIIEKYLQEVEYRFIANVVDVRKGKYAVLEHPMAKFDDANILQECLMTIVLNTDFVNPEFLTFMITPEQAKEVDEWADYIFKLSQETRRNQRGVLFYLQKLFAPLRYANNEQIITIDELVSVMFLPSRRLNSI